MKGEHNYIKNAVDPNTGLTFDGVNLDLKTGVPIDQQLHYWTASSKESIHLSVLAISLSGNSEFFIPESEVISVLTKKITTYETFNRNYPGFGGFLPWMKVYINN